MRGTAFKAMLLSLIISLVGVEPALAYIDPNTGGMLFQILAVAFASLSAVLLIFSRQIRRFFARGRRAVRGIFGGEAEPAQTGDDAGSEVVQPAERTDWPE